MKFYQIIYLLCLVICLYAVDSSAAVVCPTSPTGVPDLLSCIYITDQQIQFNTQGLVASLTDLQSVINSVHGDNNQSVSFFTGVISGLVFSFASLKRW